MIVVEEMLSVARERLVMIDEDALLTTAARLLNDRHTNLVVARDRKGAMTGVVTKTDIVRQLSRCSGSGCTAPVVYALVAIATVARIAAAVLPDWNMALLHVAAFAWAAAFLGFAGLYAPLLCLPKRPNPRGT